jgi:hypothetical protein
MYNFIRWIFGHTIALPFILIYRFLTIFMKKNNAINTAGKILTGFGVILGRMAIPNKKNQNKFIKFKNDLIHIFKKFRQMYDIDFVSESDNHVQIEISKCPITSALKNLGASELCKFLCACDFIIAKENKTRYLFSRTHSLGTDGKYCNHCFSSLE